METLTRMKKQLPQETVLHLQTLRKKDPERFYASVKGLHDDKGWSLRNIAAAMDVSASGVAVWTRKAEYVLSDGLPTVPMKDPADTQSTRKPKVEVPVIDQEKIARLTQEASSVRRFTPLDHPSREAAAELEDLLHRYRDKGVSLGQLATIANVSRRAIAQRLEKRERNG